MSWGGMHGRDRRTSNMGMPGTMNQISPLKKPYSGNVIAPPKFTRSTSSLTPKSWIDDNVFRTDNNSNSLLPLQVRMVCSTLHLVHISLCFYLFYADKEVCHYTDLHAEFPRDFWLMTVKKK